MVKRYLSTLPLVRSRTGVYRDESGMTLIEVLVAVFILSVAILAVASTATMAVKTIRTSRDRDLATQGASAALEAARGIPYDSLSLDTTNVFTGDSLVSGGTFAHDGTDAEPLIVTSGGIAPYRCDASNAASCWFDFDAFAELHEVRTYVTWFDDDDSVDSDGDGTKTNDRDARRVTVIASWETAGGTKSVRQSTIVAETGRGVGIPDFVISPTTQTSPVPSGKALCLNHVLENFGVIDSYDLWYTTPANGSVSQVASTTGASAPSLKVVFKDSGGASKTWYVHGWLGGTAWDDAAAWRDAFNNGTKPAAVGTSYMGQTDGDPPVDSPVSVPKDGKAELAICYEPAEDTTRPSPPDTVTLQPLIRSEFWTSLVGNPPTSSAGDTGVTAIEHTISVTSTSASVYLHADDATAGSPYTFSASAPTASSLPDFGPTDPTTPDFDVSDGTPGYGTRKPSAASDPSQTLVEWTDNDGDVTHPYTRVDVRLWTSWEDAIRFGSTSQKDLAFDLTVCIADASRVCQRGSQTVSRTYTHQTAGWVAQDFTFTYSTTHSVGSGEYLLLRFDCKSGTRDRDGNCHVAFGSTGFPATLKLSQP